MSSFGKLATLGLIVAAVFGATMARSDAPCNAGFRDATADERARMTAILEIAKLSLPPAPAGWQITGYEEISVPGRVCRDEESRPWGFGISRNFTRVDDYEAREQVMRDAATHAVAEQQTKQPRMDALMAKMTALSQQQAALVQKGDMAGAEKLNTDMERIQAEFSKIADEGDSQAQIVAAGKEHDRDLYLSISVRVNETAKPVASGAANFPLPSGASVAQRWIRPADSDKNEEGHAMILFGGWQREEQSRRWVSARRANAVPTAAHVISVEVVGDPSRIDPLLQGLDFTSLATALTR